MTKKIIYAFAGLLLLAVAGALVLTLTIDGIVRSSIEQIGSEMTETRVTVDGVSLSLLSGEGTITGFRVGNPEGYATAHALAVNDVYIKLDVRSLLTDEIVVEQIRVAAPFIVVEQKLTGNNLQTILNSINRKAAKTEAPDAPTEKPPEETTDTRLVITHFLLTDGSVNLYTGIGGERKARVSMSAVELHDLGRDDSSPAAEQVIRQIAEKIIEQALKASVGSGLEQIRDAIEDLFR